MTETQEHEGVEGQVVRYRSERANNHCREGVAISDHNGRYVDTFWQSMGQDSHVLTEAEVATAEHQFWLDEYRELDRSAAEIEWATYAPDDRRRVPSQHGLQVRYFVRIGAEPDLATQVENAVQTLAIAEQELEWAKRRVADAEERVDDLREKQRTATLLDPSQFPSAYKARMIQAYPVIADMGADQFFHATAEEREAAFVRILSARNLRRTHELFLESGDG